ncbi:sugar phosphate isomerase/epimerase [Streptomyces tanashiensis]
MTKPSPQPSPPSRIRIGSAPDSWGVWFPDDPRQVPWQRFLDEVSGAGYTWIELGPYGDPPTDPAVLAEETARRGLRVSAGTVFTGLHHGPGVWDRTWAHVAENAALAQAVGAGHLVVIPSFWRDDRTGEVLEEPELTAGQWRDLTRLTASVWAVPGARAVRAADRGPSARRHPHRRRGERDALPRRHGSGRRSRRSAWTPGTTRTPGGYSVKLIETYGERIGLPPPQAGRPGGPGGRGGRGGAVRSRRGAGRDARAARPGCRRSRPALAAASALDVDLFAIVEQDMYPCDPDVPYPIALRTRGFLRSCGV